MGAHESTKLLANALQNAQAVVLGKGSEEVLEDITLVGASNLLELGNDLLLVGVGQGRGTEDGDQLLVGLQGLAEGSDSLGGRVEGGGLGGGSVLQQEKLESKCFQRYVAPCLFNSGIECRGGRRGRGNTESRKIHCRSQRDRAEN